MWGNKPWDNDSAADWFSNLMDETQLPEKLRETLNKHSFHDVSEHIPEIRAAIYCMVKFCRVYVWPIENLDDDLILAIRAINTLINDGNYANDDEIIASLEIDLLKLKSRL